MLVDILGVAMVPIKLRDWAPKASALIVAAHFTLVLTVEISNKIGLLAAMRFLLIFDDRLVVV